MLAAALLSAAPARALDASSVYGFWQPPDGGRIQIQPCDDRLCGYVRDDGDKNPEVHPGHLLLKHLEYQGALTWSDGQIHNPRDNRVYGAKLRLIDTNQLKLTGCLWIFCGSQTWTRIE
ncbi:MAG: DUF2147 domain-containing protein [Sphingomonadales bacterium]